ncbi:Sodium/hydrogen exchanger family-domain-containing protein [Amylocystis lapponica]|nr:Sodium/hydrogen exchanger family-domain-containing protein [Amylocystis lapponica]
MGEFSSTILGIARFVYRKRDAPSQGGLLSGADPSDFDPTDPLRLWVIQLGVILLMTQCLSLVLGRIKQPKVIAEVIGGILLGPTAFGRIPGFTDHIFPKDSLPYLSLVADIGLCLFLFLVGLEIDGAVVRRNAKLSFVIALAGMALPFGLGAGLSVPLYHTFIDPSVKFTNFMLFTGVAYSITAFPVLCRILTELKLLDTTVGVVVLSAGVGNDVVGWVLLALSVALVNAGSGILALYILLACVAWALFLLFVVRHMIHWLARRTGSIENGPTVFFMTCVILMLFGSAFFTDIIGVQAIFGAFLAGLIVPREGGLAIALTEKLEDMVSVIFLPLYFTLSGLNTNLGLLNNGITWGYTIAICALSYFGKFGGCTISARFAGFSWREASTIGSLMSCKGLVELIVLNVGLSAGILSQRVFSMFVLEAIVLTFMTTPAVVLLYPPSKRVRVVPAGANFNNVRDDTDTSAAASKSEGAVLESSADADDTDRKSRVTVVLDKLEHLPGMMALTQLLLPPPPSYAEKEATLSVSGVPSIDKKPIRRELAQDMSIDALRLIELSDRTSAVMKSSSGDTLLATDPLLNIFGTFGDLNGMPVSSSLAIVPYDDLAASVAEHAQRHRSQLVLLPWLPAQLIITEPSHATSPGGEPVTPRITTSHMTNPFEALFRATTYADKSASALHAHFVRGVFAQSSTDVALFLDRRTPGDTGGGAQHLFLPFCGGPDDRLALDFIVQLCAHPRVSATVLRITKAEFDLSQSNSLEPPSKAHLGDERMGDAMRENLLTVNTATVFPDTVYGQHSTQTRLQSETADNVAWARYAQAPDDGPQATALSRIEFSDVRTPLPLHTIVEHAARIQEAAAARRSRALVVVGRSRRLAVESHQGELKQLMEEHSAVGNEVKRTVGDIGTALVVGGCKASVVVLQAAILPID